MKVNPNLIPSVYHQINSNFETMINQDQYKDSLFIFNDNHLQHKTVIKGRGNAVIRPYNQYSTYNPPKSIGISTGYSINTGGFKSLNQKFIFNCRMMTAKNIIDNECNEIGELLKKHVYYNIIFSSTDKDGSDIGTGLFNVGEDVRKYILGKIKSFCE